MVLETPRRRLERRRIAAPSSLLSLWVLVSDVDLAHSICRKITCQKSEIFLGRRIFSALIRGKIKANPLPSVRERWGVKQI
jgi:hypothetical protein